MTIKIGNSSIKRIQLGSNIVKSAYLGNVLVYGQQIDTPVEPPVEIQIDASYNYFMIDTSLSEYNSVSLIRSRAGDETSWDELTDWGDGTVNSENTHTYSSNGIYVIKTKWIINNYLYNFSGDKVLRTMLVKCLNVNNNMTCFGGLFFGCINLISVDFDKNSTYTSTSKSMSCTFFGCRNLKSIDLSNFETSDELKYMYATFRGCSSLTSLDLSNFYVYNLQTIQDLFRDCIKLNKLNLGEFFIAYAGINRINMFYNTPELLLENIIVGDLMLNKITEAYNKKDTLDPNNPNSTDEPLDFSDTLWNEMLG